MSTMSKWGRRRAAAGARHSRGRMRLIRIAALLLVPALAFAQRTPILQQLTFTPYHAGGIYEVGETVGWTVTPGPGDANVRVQVDDPPE